MQARSAARIQSTYVWVHITDTLSVNFIFFSSSSLEPQVRSRSQLLYEVRSDSVLGEGSGETQSAITAITRWKLTYVGWAELDAIESRSLHVPRTASVSRTELVVNDGYTHQPVMRYALGYMGQISLVWEVE
jgi:hypothetical protein